MTSEPRKEPDSEWIRALVADALGASPTRPMVRGFAEARVDVRVRFEGPTVSESATTRTAGVAATFAESEATESRRSCCPPERSILDLDVPDPAPAREWVEHVSRAAGSLSVRAVWVESDQVVTIAREDGLAVSDRRRGGRLRVVARLERGGQHAEAVADVVRTAAGLGDPVAAAAVLERRARDRLDAADPPAGEHAAVFASGIGGVLVHELIGHALEGDVVATGASRLARDTPGFRSPEVRVVDDPRRCRVAWSVDDEGEPARAIGLIERGRVAGALLDRRRARSGDGQSTGHGRRASYLDDVRPRMGCTFLAAGRLEDDEIVADTKRGLFVRRMEAASTDPVAGLARFRVTDADRIVDGKIERAVHPFELEVELGEMLDTLDRLGRSVEVDRCVGACVKGGQTLATSVGAPTIRIGLVRVIP